MIIKAIAYQLLMVVGGAYCHSLASQIPNFSVPTAEPISAVRVQSDNGKSLEGMSDSELYFKYKTEKSFEAKIKILLNEKIMSFDARLAGELDKRFRKFQKEHDDEKKQIHQETGADGQPKTMENMNKTWVDIIDLVGQVSMLHNNITEQYKSQLILLFYSDEHGEGHERIAQYFVQGWEEFETKNKDFIKNDLPKMKSHVKQNKMIDKLTSKMTKEYKSFVNSNCEDYEFELLKMAMGQLDGILKEYTSTESHTHWKDQTKQFFDGLLDEKESKEWNGDAQK